MAKIIKASTGLTGLAVSTNPHHTLSALYGKILGAVSKMPQEASYRKYTEQLVKQRADSLAQHKDITALEKAVGCGQVEELIVQAENELILARKMLGWKPWEKLIQAAPAKQWDWPPAQIMEPKV
ncbi:NADH dehydrogenase [ubiquinone] 1 alpha subcomplex subunit 5 [Drosophila teissieri]|uniref:NADH dehydrogenase [ubiquinone] 1 alpha subcomplex subunit 5 n=1 Tax=Drosophila teissieri TaxID=7243 RepID=UPI001CBA49C1|nr:NADH dehydrogenase [ubiquinone] 1 alpha subcomplex subunit 5 [Drosophila teissieri]